MGVGVGDRIRRRRELEVLADTRVHPGPCEKASEWRSRRPIPQLTPDARGERAGGPGEIAGDRERLPQRMPCFVAPLPAVLAKQVLHAPPPLGLLDAVD